MEIVKQTITNLPNFFDLFKLWRFQATEEMYQNFLSNISEKHHFYFCYLENDIVGAMVIYQNEIIDIAVREETHNRDVGRGLINFAIKSGLFNFLMAKTDDAVGFYKFCGFTIEIGRIQV